MDWFDLLAGQGTLKSLLQHQNLKVSFLGCSAFFLVQLTSVHDYWKNHPFDSTDLFCDYTKWYLCFFLIHCPGFSQFSFQGWLIDLLTHHPGDSELHSSLRTSITKVTPGSEIFSFPNQSSSPPYSVSTGSQERLLYGRLRFLPSLAFTLEEPMAGYITSWWPSCRVQSQD